MPTFGRKSRNISEFGRTKSNTFFGSRESKHSKKRRKKSKQTDIWSIKSKHTNFWSRQSQKKLTTSALKGAGIFSVITQKGEISFIEEFYLTKKMIRHKYFSDFSLSDFRRKKYPLVEKLGLFTCSVHILGFMQLANQTFKFKQHGPSIQLKLSS